VIEPRHRWIYPTPVTLAPEFLAAASRHELTDRAAGLLAGRGLAAVELDAFFGPPLRGLNDPRLLPDADRLVDRLARARRDGERVMVFGDFDADGLTGLAILVLALRRLGLEVVPYVPSRLDEGHGLSLPAVEAARAAGTTLIVTVDCGTTSHAEIAAAGAAGIDVVVTDHHRVPSTLPPAVAVVNPHRDDSHYPDRRLAGSGVAFTVARLLLEAEPGGPDAALALSDLATVGTVADVAPTLGENRAIARLGLERLNGAPRPGLAALLERSGRRTAVVDLESVAFLLAPRLNAAGRVGEAMVAARLLLADDPTEAAALADELESANAVRRDLTRTALAEARAALGLAPAHRDAPDEAVTPTLWPHEIVASPGAEPALDADVAIVRGAWPVGVIGLVAGRLAETLGRPAIVGAELGPVVRASCRSDGSLDLGHALEACADLFVRFGGHAGAAGFEIVAERWDEFRRRFAVVASAAAPVDRRPTLRLDLAVSAAACDYALHRDLVRLAPTGPGNPDPLVAVHGLTVTRVRGASGGHTQLTLRRERDVVDGIAFDWPELAARVSEGDRLDVVGRLTSRRFGGFESLQIEIRDAAPAGAHPEVSERGSAATEVAREVVVAGAGVRVAPAASDGPHEA
jgi:single-stranded-DNA-specific exonuclease